MKHEKRKGHLRPVGKTIGVVNPRNFKRKKSFKDYIKSFRDYCRNVLQK